MQNTPDASTSPPDPPARRGVPSIPPTAPAAEVPGLLVLYVENHAETRRLVRRLLRERCEVHGADTLDEALALADRWLYDAVLVDINLAGDTSGLAVLEALRARPAYRLVPVAAVTAFALPGDRERFLRAGFDHYLAKPFGAADLVALVDDLIGSDRA